VFNKKKHKNKVFLKNHNQYHVYSQLIFTLLNNINLETDFILTLDRFISPINDDNFKKAMIKELEKTVRNSKIHHSNSEKWKGIQFADLIAWSCFQKFERNKTKYLEKLKNKHEIFHF